MALMLMILVQSKVEKPKVGGNAANSKASKKTTSNWKQPTVEDMEDDDEDEKGGIKEEGDEDEVQRLATWVNGKLVDKRLPVGR